MPDEGVTARVNLSDPEFDSTLTADRLVRNQAPAASVVNKLTSFASIPITGDLNQAMAKAITDSQMGLVSSAIQPAGLKTHFHDTGSYSEVVLANVREGGLKRDLTRALYDTTPPVSGSIFTDAGGIGPNWDIARSWVKLKVDTSSGFPTATVIQPHRESSQSVGVVKALALWPWGDCWNGGGLFMSDSRFWRNAGYHSDEPDTVGRLRKKLVEEPGYPFEESYGGECPGVYYHRLQRDGWKLARIDPPAANDQVAVFEKPLPKGWVLEKSAHASIDSPVGSGCYYDTHRLIHPESGTILDHPEREWADLDRKRMVWVTKGVLFAAKIHGKGLGDVKALHDFNDMTFEAIAAPY